MPHIVDVHSHIALAPTDLPPELAGAVEIVPNVAPDGRQRITRKGISILRYPEFFDTDKQYEVCKRAGITRRLISPAMQLNNWVESLTSCRSVELARKVNDCSAALRRRYPDMIRTLASVDPLEPSDNLAELDRCVDELGMVGVVVEPSWRGLLADEEPFYDFWEHVEGRNIPVFLHPPMIPLCHLKLNAYKLEETVGRPCETALCVARMLCSGLFDRFPGLRIVLAHMGGGLMPVVGRLDMGYRLDYTGLPEIEHARCELTPSEYLRRNLWVDTMGFSLPTVRQAIEVFGDERVMFGSDYAPVPIDPIEHVEIVKALGLDRDGEERVLWRNADAFFDLGLTEADR